MDRDKVLELGRKVLNRIPLEQQEAITLVSEYCVERGKNPEMVKSYVPLLASSPYFIMMCERSLEYFEKKFNIKVLSSALSTSIIYQKY